MKMSLEDMRCHIEKSKGYIDPDSKENIVFFSFTGGNAADSIEINRRSLQEALKVIIDKIPQVRAGIEEFNAAEILCFRCLIKHCKG